MKKLLLIAIIFMQFQLVSAQIDSIDYFGQTPPGDYAVIFAPGIISQAGRFEECIAFSPDGQEICVDITDSGWNSFTLYHCEFNGKTWTELTVADFVSGNDNCAAHYTPDGSKFIYTSGSPRNIYAINISETGYGSPIIIPSPVSSLADEWHATFSLDNTLYFHSHRNGGLGESDIYYSVPNQGHYDAVYNIGRPVNSTAKDADPFISPEGDYMLFNSTRAGGYGYHDLYVSFKKTDGSWTTPKNLGDKINSNQRDIWASVSPDGKYIFFTRRTENLESDIYWVSSSVIDDIRKTALPDPNGLIQNTASGQRFSSLQCAIDYANPNETLVLQPGTYTESIILDKDLVLRSVDPNDPFYIGGTILQADVNEPVVKLNNNTQTCLMAGLTLRAGSVGILGTNTNATIRNCRIMDNVTHGLELSQESSPHLLHCLITGNGQTGINMIADTDRRIVTLCKPIIEDCVIVQNGESNLVGGEPTIVDSIIPD